MSYINTVRKRLTSVLFRTEGFEGYWTVGERVGRRKTGVSSATPHQ